MAMQSTTTLTNSLSDYHIQLTGAADEGALPIRRTQLRVQGRNPSNWPTNYRRIPPHRPVNRNLDLTERPNGASTGEWIFVNVMLNGVRLNSLFVTSYESTLGRFYPSLTRYEIGGEW